MPFSFSYPLTAHPVLCLERVIGLFLFLSFTRNQYRISRLNPGRNMLLGYSLVKGALVILSVEFAIALLNATRYARFVVWERTPHREPLRHSGKLHDLSEVQGLVRLWRK
jgi:hypothetical protein